MAYRARRTSRSTRSRSGYSSRARSTRARPVSRRRSVSRGSRGGPQTVRIVLEQAPASVVARQAPDLSMIGKKPADKPVKAKF